MPFNLDIKFLFLFIAISMGILLLMRALQRAALAELARVLYEQGDAGQYMRMLDSGRLTVVLRRSTVLLLKLDGYIYQEDADGVWATCDALEQARRLRPAEKLNWYQKALAFAVTKGDKKRAKDYYERLQTLLENEKDESLRQVLADARLLVGVYIDKNTRLIPQLEKLAKTQEGNRLGLTQYRLAKLYHFDNNDAQALQYLKQAQQNLTGTVWLPVVRDALQDTTVLEEK